MTVPLRDINADTGDTGPSAPQVFVRALRTPPGSPWEQARAARLDARHGAPLPVAELLHQVRRLDRWAPGRPGLYAAFYVRRREYRAPFEATVEVEGQPLKVRFGVPARDTRQLKAGVQALVSLVLCGALLGAGTMLAFKARREASVRLEAVDQLAAARMRAGEATQARARSARDVPSLTHGARPMGVILGDLAWIASAKAPDGRIVGIHYERGLLAVEARGEAPPFLAADRSLERSKRPLRPGVWLWAVGSAAPVVASGRAQDDRP